MTMPAGDLVAEEVEETFVEATGVEPEITQIVGSVIPRRSRLPEHLSQSQIDAARLAIYEEQEPGTHTGAPSPDAIGDSTVSESWAIPLHSACCCPWLFSWSSQPSTSLSVCKNTWHSLQWAQLIVDGIVIAGIYSLFGFEVSPTIIGLLTVLTFSIYDTVIF